MMNRYLIAILLVLVIGASAYGATTFSAFRHEMHALGMGDAYTAHGRTVTSFLYNPAMLARNTGYRITILNLPISFNTRFTDVINYMDEYQEEFENWDSLSSDRQREILTDIDDFDDQWVTGGAYPEAAVTTPIGLGVAVYNNLTMRVKLDRGIYDPRGYADLNNDLVFVAGYARQVTPKLAVGGNIKSISRRYSGTIRLAASQFGDTEKVFEEAEDSLESAKAGFGFDIGALYAINPNLDVGASMIDLLGSIDGAKTPINFRVGAAYHYREGFVKSSFLREIIIAGDIDDMFNRDGDHLFNKMHLGVDVVMPILGIRFGFNQGYPCFGAGLDLKFVGIDYAFVGRELLGAPGRESAYDHYLQLKIGVF